MPNNSVFAAFFQGNTASLTASNQDFNPIFNEGGLSGDVNLGSLSAEFGAIVDFVHTVLGEPILAVELTPKQIAMAFEYANLVFSSIVNTYFVESWMTSLLGVKQNYSQYNFQTTLPNSNNIFFQMFANSMLLDSGIYSGKITTRKGYVETSVDQQLYDVYSSAVDSETGLPIEQYVASVTGYGVHFVNFYVNSEFYMNRLYDPLTNQQFMQSEFGFPAYPTDTVFYLMPIGADMLRGQNLHTSDYVRKSRVQWSLVGRKLELIPRPKRPVKIWFEYYVDKEAGQKVDPLLESSYSGLSYLSTVSAAPVATHFGNVPISDLSYDKMNSIGKTWIRRYTLGFCYEILGGNVRGKYPNGIPIPGGENLTLNGASLEARGLQMMQKLEDDLKLELAKLDNYELLKKEVEKAQSLAELRKYDPMPIYVY